MSKPKSKSGGGCSPGVLAVSCLVVSAAGLIFWQASTLLRRDVSPHAVAPAAAAARSPPLNLRSDTAFSATLAAVGSSIGVGGAPAALDARSEVDAALARLDASLARAAAAAPAAGVLRGGSEQPSAAAAVRELSDSVAALRRELPQLVAAEVASRGAGAQAPQAAAAAASSQAVAQVQPAVPTPPALRRRVVLGLAKGVDAPLLYRFVRSLRAVTNADAVDVVIFLHEADAPAGSPLAWALEAYGAQVQRFDPAAFAEPRHRAYHPSSYRWLLMRDWLRSPAAAAAGYEAVLFADVRDVIFAADPFAPMARVGAGAGAGALAPAFYAFLEAKPRTIAECGWNAGWVRDCFGEAGLAAVGSQLISCSGTSLATWAAAQAYAALLADELAGNACERNGADQGVHNYFVYGGRLREALAAADDAPTAALTLVSNEDGWVGTVQSMHALTRDRAGRLLNERGQPYALVHQYDRSRVLVEQLEREMPWMEPGTVGK